MAAPELDTIKCKRCDKVIIPRTSWQAFCSTTCRNKWWTNIYSEMRQSMMRKHKKAGKR